MRFCLKCRQFSGGGPLCTRCGRSFGGRLCKGRTRHLNPYDARFCNHCGTSELIEGASSIPFGWVSRVLTLVGVVLLGKWLLTIATGASNFSFQNLTGYADARVWLIEKLAGFLMPLLVFAFLSAFIPGEAGKRFRAIMFGLVEKAVVLFFKLAEKVLISGGKLLMQALGVKVDSGKKKK